jgi:hypothetical protein
MTHENDLYLVDEEFLYKGGYLRAIYSDFCDILEGYVTAVDWLCSHIEGDTANSIKELADSLRGMSLDISEASDLQKSDCEQFIAELEIADSFLYQA